jgi:hypothetical protein
VPETPLVPATRTQADTATVAATAVAEQVAEKSSASGVAPAVAHKELPTGDWRDRLVESLQALQQELSSAPAESRERAVLEQSERLLHVLANHSEQAVAGIDGLSADEREFWKHLMHALLLALDADGKNAAGRRAALALRELRSASDYLANMSTLDVRNLALCQRVESFGQFTEFAAQSFRPGQEVLLYVEIDNFTVQPVGDKFETEMRATYDILDESGQRIRNVELPLDKQLGNNRRRDYYVSYSIHLPTDIAKGSYTLQLTVEDVKGQKSSQASIDFRIR